MAATSKDLTLCDPLHRALLINQNLSTIEVKNECLCTHRNLRLMRETYVYAMNTAEGFLGYMVTSKDSRFKALSALRRLKDNRKAHNEPYVEITIETQVITNLFILNCYYYIPSINQG